MLLSSEFIKIVAEQIRSNGVYTFFYPDKTEVSIYRSRKLFIGAKTIYLYLDLPLSLVNALDELNVFEGKEQQKKGDLERGDRSLRFSKRRLRGF